MFEREKEALATASGAIGARMQDILHRAAECAAEQLGKLPAELKAFERRFEEAQEEISRGARRTDGRIV